MASWLDKILKDVKECMDKEDRKDIEFRLNLLMSEIGTCQNM